MVNNLLTISAKVSPFMFITIYIQQFYSSSFRLTICDYFPVPNFTAKPKIVIDLNTLDMQEKYK